MTLTFGIEELGHDHDLEASDVESLGVEVVEGMES